MYVPHEDRDHYSNNSQHLSAALLYSSATSLGCLEGRPRHAPSPSPSSLGVNLPTGSKHEFPLGCWGDFQLPVLLKIEFNPTCNAAISLSLQNEVTAPNQSQNRHCYLHLIPTSLTILSPDRRKNDFIY